MKTSVLLLSALLVASTAARSASAQPMGPVPPPPDEIGADEPPPSPEQVEVKIRKLRAKLLRQRVGLGEAKAAEVEAVFERFAPRARELDKRIRNAKAKLHYLLQTESDDQGEFAKAITDERKSHQDMMKLRDEEFRELQKLLTPKQQAVLLLALERLQRRLHEGGRPGRGPHGMGPGVPDAGPPR